MNNVEQHTDITENSVFVQKMCELNDPKLINYWKWDLEFEYSL